VKAARNRPFMTDNISQLLIYLAGISCPYYRDADNLISPHYQTHRKRMLMNLIDYDKAIRE
jgi:heptose-I-phosphate ethanolaminephosphotransferase